MSTDEVLNHVAQAKGQHVWFNNGKKRSRCVVGFNAYMICYYTPSKPGCTTCSIVGNFAKWAKGVGKAGQKEVVSNESTVKELG